MTQEFIYNIKNIFGSDADSLLRSTATNHFYIGPYQRGYKWSTEPNSGQVAVLIDDVKASMEKGDNEYFLQYITVKIDSERKRLEVVDGQQRLTTLSLMFYMLEALEFGNNIAKDKLNYARFGDENIFDKVIEHMQNVDEETDEEIDTQDFYYLVKAARYIGSEFEKLKNDAKLDVFIGHLLHKVKLIVNIESNFVSSEEIFANLNDNRVPLTDAYLIKGLLITRAVKRTNSHGMPLAYNEIQEKRQSLGREWDTMLSWISQPAHCHFFFKKAEGNYDEKYAMEYLLKLAYQFRYEGVKDIDNEGTYPLYHAFEKVIKTERDAVEMCDALSHVYHRLRTIFESKKALIYNLLGYLNFAKGASYSTLDAVKKSNDELRKDLLQKVEERIPNMEKLGRKEFYYKASNQNLTNLLLSFSVFIPLKEDASFHYDFFNYDNATSWSFEHISPQNPKGELKIPAEIQDFVFKRLDSESQLPDAEKKSLIDKIKRGDKIDSEKLDFLYDSEIDVDAPGNMSLLSREVNSANNNFPFAIKRKIILERKSKGYFIPDHTFKVFMKMLLPKEKTFNAENLVWNQIDVDAHEAWMMETNKDLLDWIGGLQK